MSAYIKYFYPQRTRASLGTSICEPLAQPNYITNAVTNAIRVFNHEYESHPMPIAQTPIARTKTAAISRVLDLTSKGYTRWTYGRISPTKALALFCKLQAQYGIGLTPAQRITKRKAGLANVALVVYWPEHSEMVEWLMLATDGAGLEHEKLNQVMDKKKLNWLGYELTRYAARGRTVWTWRRSKNEMEDLYNLLSAQLNQHQFGAVAESLRRIAAQPGFHGVREQSKALCQFAIRRGFSGVLPMLFYVQKVRHGDLVVLHP